MTLARRNRSGTTLIEILIAMAVSTALIGMLAMICERLIAANAASHDHLEDVAIVGRLAEQFRQDVREARDAQLIRGSNGPGTLILRRPDAVVEYASSEWGVTRTETIDSKGTAQEDYALRRWVVADWQVDSSDRRVTNVTLRLAAATESAQQLSRSIEIAGVLAAPHRSGGQP